MIYSIHIIHIILNIYHRYDIYYPYDLYYPYDIYHPHHICNISLICVLWNIYKATVVGHINGTTQKTLLCKHKLDVIFCPTCWMVTVLFENCQRVHICRREAHTTS